MNHVIFLPLFHCSHTVFDSTLTRLALSTWVWSFKNNSVWMFCRRRAGRFQTPWRRRSSNLNAPCLSSRHWRTRLWELAIGTSWRMKYGNLSTRLVSDNSLMQWGTKGPILYSVLLNHLGCWYQYPVLGYHLPDCRASPFGCGCTWTRSFICTITYIVYLDLFRHIASLHVGFNLEIPPHFPPPPHTLLMLVASLPHCALICARFEPLVVVRHFSGPGWETPPVDCTAWQSAYGLDLRNRCRQLECLKTVKSTLGSGLVTVVL